jgi:hypothetical protein
MAHNSRKVKYEFFLLKNPSLKFIAAQRHVLHVTRLGCILILE